MTIYVPITIEDVKPNFVTALKSQDFGILTEIDVQKINDGEGRCGV
jgi:hypothetical protein